LFKYVLFTSTPGAYVATHGPKFEKDAGVSVASTAATVMAADAELGEDWHASAALLPAATTTTIPKSTSSFTSVFSTRE